MSPLLRTRLRGLAALLASKAGLRGALPEGWLQPQLAFPYTAPRPPGWPLLGPRLLNVGLPKTATTSLAMMLQELGFNRLEYDHPALLQLAAAQSEAALERTERYEFVRDMPWCLMYREYLARYPAAKFILTTRRSEAAWLASLRQHDAAPENHGYEPPTLENATRWRATDLVTLLGATSRTDAYRRHNQAVGDFFADKPGKLLHLCWETGDGWPELCRFLGRAVPKGLPVPRENPARQAPQSRPKLFCIGYSCTGLNTMSRCLDALGYSHLRYDIDFVLDLAAGRVAETVAATAPYDALLGLPWSLIYRELAARYPDARFILTTCPSDDAWLERNAQDCALWAHFPENPAIAAASSRLLDQAGAQRDAPGAEYRWHNQAVRSFFANQPGRLLELCWDQGDGWDKLCGFLGVPAPDQPLPHDADHPF